MDTASDMEVTGTAWDTEAWDTEAWDTEAWDTEAWDTEAWDMVAMAMVIRERNKLRIRMALKFSYADKKANKCTYKGTVYLLLL